MAFNRDKALKEADKLVAKGKEFFELGSDEVILSCVNCHAMHAVGDEKPLEGGDSSGPDLTGYGSEAWLKSFISDPKKYYGKRNAMPPYADTLSAKELQLIVDWMRHDWYEPPALEHASKADK